MAFEFNLVCGTCGGTGVVKGPQGAGSTCHTCLGVGTYVSCSMPDLAELAENVKKILELVKKA